jgi:hypothetical protein
VQSVPGVLANADDFVLNNQETDRGDISSVCDERTLFELYYRGYKGAIDAGVASVMCSCVGVALITAPAHHLRARGHPLQLSATRRTSATLTIFSTRARPRTKA